MIPAGKEYAVHHGDCIEAMATLPDACFDMAIFSPPFPQVFSYTELECDIGNSEEMDTEALLHLSFFYRQLARVVKPGRVIMVHVTQIPRMKRESEEGGLHDFRGLNIKLGRRAGLVYDYDWLVTRNPQAQAIRTKSRCLQFAGLETDRTQSRGALGDYLIKFRVPGENKVPVNDKDEIRRNDWIKYAEAAWTDIRETHTLNVKGTKGENDTRHICALQLDTIERLVRLYTNRGEVVFSPFAGIGSEGYVALRHGRRFYGAELKDEYYRACLDNLDMAIRQRKASERTLFSHLEEVEA